MRVFISWSGSRSQKIAEVLKEWLPTVVQSVDAWVSSKDIQKGSVSLTELNSQLKDAKFGIVCLTPENLSEKWIHFEAGAIAKAVLGDEVGRLWTYLYGLSHSDVQGPLSQFQHTVAEKEDTRKLIMAINGLSERPLTDSRLQTAFEGCWPVLNASLEDVRAIKVPEIAAKPRPLESMTEEILEMVRGLVRQQSRKPIPQILRVKANENVSLRDIGMTGPGWEASHRIWLTFTCPQCSSLIRTSTADKPSADTPFDLLCSKCEWKGQLAAQNATVDDLSFSQVTQSET